jgi:pimeloyl-ACP methyl ester carboxylesterase
MLMLTDLIRQARHLLRESYLTRHSRLAFVALFAALSVLAGCAPAGIMPDMLDGFQPVSYQPVGIGDDAVKLAVHETGKGPPLILLHGLGASSYTWRKVIPELAKNHRVIAIDLKGFGKSDKPLDSRYSLLDHARLIEDFILRRKLRNVTLTGHSYGGGVALAVALNLKDGGYDHVSRLILIDSIAYRQPLPFFFQVLKTPFIGEIGISIIPPEVQMGRALTIAYHEDDKVTDETIDAYASSLRSEGGRHALLYTIDQLDPDLADQFSRRYAELKQPALVIWCGHDKIVPLPYGRRLARDLPNADFNLIPDCGHIPHEEQPEATINAIRSFAASRSDSG